MTLEIGGVFPVLPTIFDESGAIDRDGLAKVIDYAIASGVDGVVFPGLASEYDVLTLAERLALIAFVGAHVAGRVTFIVGASSDAVDESVRLASAGAAAGAHAAMVMTPRALGPDLAALGAFYASLGTQAGLPLMVQNAPVPMGLGLATGQLKAVLAATDEVRWVKEENMPCGQRISSLLADRPASLLGVFGGAGGRYITDELARGAVGTMPAAETPEIHVALMAAHRAGEDAQVRDAYESVLPILMMQAVFRWRLTKEVLRRRGLVRSAFTRASGPELDRGDHEELSRILNRLDARSGGNWSAAGYTATR
ncbi:dihydrodipicolinate synthase family protein [Sphingomonas sp. AR_OL41]|uniref:dihydrodipicolinate synthase family protein n=1 Tax=Sphingomonas sp. AR_OL41 TaxID=3042729 RepID=UPI00247FE58F|nr:dihydrodipicolinate synthase family protein [Sphingomonas sp. AR_OL41]MDH7973909.1 dihydrodipicolinate synthase family protein [Sphingomonas sp. AR_OL41]